MPNELTYMMPQINWLTLWSGNVTYLCHVATRVVARSSTHVIHMKTAWGPLSCLQKARWKLNLDIVDIRRPSKSESKPNFRCSVRAGQGSGNGGNRKCTAHVNTCSVQSYVPEVFRLLTWHPDHSDHSN